MTYTQYKLNEIPKNTIITNVDGDEISSLTDIETNLVGKNGSPIFKDWVYDLEMLLVSFSDGSRANIRLSWGDDDFRFITYYAYRKRKDDKTFTICDENGKTLCDNIERIDPLFEGEYKETHYDDGVIGPKHPMYGKDFTMVPYYRHVKDYYGETNNREKFAESFKLYKLGGGDVFSILGKDGLMYDFDVVDMQFLATFRKKKLQYDMNKEIFVLTHKDGKHSIANMSFLDKWFYDGESYKFDELYSLESNNDIAKRFGKIDIHYIRWDAPEIIRVNDKYNFVPTPERWKWVSDTKYTTVLFPSHWADNIDIINSKATTFLFLVVGERTILLWNGPNLYESGEEIYKCTKSKYLIGGENEWNIYHTEKEFPLSAFSLDAVFDFGTDDLNASGNIIDCKYPIAEHNGKYTYIDIKKFNFLFCKGKDGGICTKTVNRRFRPEELIWFDECKPYEETPDGFRFEVVENGKTKAYNEYGLEIK